MYPDEVNILIACEESQAEEQAFERAGFNVFSCDLQRARYNPARHIYGDVSPYLDG